MGPLDGIKVLDMSRYIAGPTASMMLADQGAEVLKVESLPLGDPSRQSGPFVGDQSVYFMSTNRNKKSLAIDLRQGGGKAVVARLASTVDVFIENFRPGLVAEMGLGLEQLMDINPKLVYCSISGFGSGPVGSKMAGFDQTVQGMSGLMSVTGTEETGPLRVGIPIADSTTGLVAAFAIEAKLLERARTGVGGFVSTSLMQSMTFLMTYQAQKFLSLGIVAGREGNDHPLLFPQGTFKTADGYITIASGNERMWRLLCTSLGLDEIAEYPQFSTNEARLENKVELRTRIEACLSTGSAAEWIERIGSNGVPCGRVLNMQEAFSHEVSVELGLSKTVEHSSLGMMEVLGRPAETGTADWLRLAPPTLGENSVEILSGNGFAGAEIDELLDSGIVVQG